jgi:hypothetical protein
LKLLQIKATMSDSGLTEEQKHKALGKLEKNWVIPWTPETLDSYYEEHVEPYVIESEEFARRSIGS